MGINNILSDLGVKLITERELNPDDFVVTVNPLIENSEYEIRLDYTPKDMHRIFKLRPFYEAGALSEYMISQQIIKQIDIFLNEIAPKEEWPNDQN